MVDARPYMRAIWSTDLCSAGALLCSHAPLYLDVIISLRNCLADLSQLLGSETRGFRGLHGVSPLYTEPVVLHLVFWRGQTCGWESRQVFWRYQYSRVIRID